MHMPDGLDHLWAKGRQPNQQRGESLVEHTWQVLVRLADLYRLRPDLPATLNAPRLWHRLFWACLLHDLGKATEGFQAAVRKESHRWSKRHYRHEVGSLAFVHWFFGAEDDDYAWIVAAIASHHKDAAQINADYQEVDDEDDDGVADIIGQFKPDDIAALWRWLTTCPPLWVRELGLSAAGIELLEAPSEAVVGCARAEGRMRVHRALRTYRRFIRDLEEGRRAGDVVATIALRGLTVTADHLGSAHAALGSGLHEDSSALLARLRLPDGTSYKPYEHQLASARQSGTALLVAPTGSGKTEAALCWALGMGVRPVPRLFYALPYQASMNAMYDRLRALFPDQVGLQHSRALAALYRRLGRVEDDYESTMRAARWARNLTSLHALPVTVFSPYQMLKALYRLKGYEAMLTDYAGAVFIFDEIHAYEPKRLALILTLTAYLQRHYGARCFVMSATFPTLVRRQLERCLGVGADHLVTASDDLFRDFRRHRLRLLDSDLLKDGLPRIAAAANAGQSVLVCCNTVQRAQDAYSQLGTLLNGAIERVLIHGRFTIRDRQAKEAVVVEATGVRSDQRRPIVVVATQVVEVSLNIDLDTIYADPAPLEALVQRFGRVNRQRRIALADVHVFRQPVDGHGIYNPALVAGALTILEREQGQALDEAAIGSWLDEIYTGDVAANWQREFDEHAADCERACLRTLRAFDSSKDLEEAFYKAFDSVEVLPRSLEAEYLALQLDEPLRAAELLVSISHGRYHLLARNGRVREGEDGLKIVSADYDAEIGLTFDE